MEEPKDDKTESPPPSPKEDVEIVQVQKKADKRAKPRSQAQLDAFEKARAKREANLKAKKEKDDTEYKEYIKQKELKEKKKKEPKKKRIVYVTPPPSSDEESESSSSSEEVIVQKAKPKKILKKKLPKQESSSEEEEEQPQQGNSFMDFWRNTWIRKTGIFAQFLLDFLIFSQFLTILYDLKISFGRPWD